MLNNHKEQLFVHKYLVDCLEDGESIGTVYKDIFEPDGYEDIRVYTGKGKKLIKTKRCMEEIARLQSKESMDFDTVEDVKKFVSKELMDIYMVSSCVIPCYDRNGKHLEGKSEFMDSSAMKSSIEMLGRSVGLFKEVNENINKEVIVELDGVVVNEIIK